LVEVLALGTGVPAKPGEAGTLVVTPFAPYRDATVILRYDTEDVVRPLVEPPCCELRHMPATSDLLGKRRLAVRHEVGWTFPREVLEALEAVDAVPLPARYGFWAVPGGVAVEVVASAGTEATRRQIEAQLEAYGVPARRVHLVPDPAHLKHPRPLRCDLREQLFVPWLPFVAGTGT
jgi:phenylacetate-coenzyme A ligase PaaK-like adenylate-forming protein